MWSEMKMGTTVVGHAYQNDVFRLLTHMTWNVANRNTRVCNSVSLYSLTMNQAQLPFLSASKVLQRSGACATFVLPSLPPRYYCFFDTQVWWICHLGPKPSQDYVRVSSSLRCLLPFVTQTRLPPRAYLPRSVTPRPDNFPLGRGATECFPHFDLILIGWLGKSFINLRVFISAFATRC